MARQCPKCKRDMRPLRLQNVAVDLCPVCMGMWFDAHEVSRAAGLKFSDSADGAGLASARRSEHRCPTCAIRLYEREIGRGSGIFIDQCPQCAGLFTDKDELGRIQAYFRSQGVAERPAPSARPTPSDRPAPQEEHALDRDSALLMIFQYLTGLPLEVDVPQRLFPPIVTALIVANVAVFVAALLTGYEAWIRALGVVPVEVASGHRLYTLLTSTFMHGGVIHLLGNMYFLYIAGDNVEERFGWQRFLPFYLLCGLAAGAADVLGRMGSSVPAVGASGAISGVLGAYVVLFPRNRFLFRWLLGWRYLFRRFEFEVPAFVYLGVWVLFQVFYAVLRVPGVAWWAHIAGFAVGVGIAAAVRLRRRGG